MAQLPYTTLTLVKITLFLATFQCLLPAMAAGQEGVPQCGPRDQVISGLSSYGETLQSSGASVNGLITEVYANPGKGTWSWVVTRPDGFACIVMHGGLWSAIREEGV